MSKKQKQDTPAASKPAPQPTAPLNELFPASENEKYPDYLISSLYLKPADCQNIFLRTKFANQPMRPHPEAIAPKKAALFVAALQNLQQAEEQLKKTANQLQLIHEEESPDDNKIQEKVNAFNQAEQQVTEAQLQLSETGSALSENTKRILLEQNTPNSPFGVPLDQLTISGRLKMLYDDLQSPSDKAQLIAAMQHLKRQNPWVFQKFMQHSETLLVTKTNPTAADDLRFSFDHIFQMPSNSLDDFNRQIINKNITLEKFTTPKLFEKALEKINLLEKNYHSIFRVIQDPKNPRRSITEFYVDPNGYRDHA